MNKIYKNIGLAVAVTSGLLSITTKALAGEGGIAGTASFVLDATTGG